MFPNRENRFERNDFFKMVIDERNQERLEYPTAFKLWSLFHVMNG